MNSSLLFKGPDAINLELQPLLDDMKEAGILLDASLLNGLADELNKKIKVKEKQAYSALGHEFNLNSPKQLKEILYGELQLTPTKRTKTGFSTDEQTLKNLLNVHPLIPIVLEYRELYKVLSTYVSALPKTIGPDGRVHTTFLSDKTATGRLSSHDPNLQNIPIKGEWGTKIRKAFIAKSGCVFITADYAQFEFRILAHFSQDTKLLSLFTDNIDMHTATAAQLFKKDPLAVTKDERRMAKTVNFGVLYGMSAHGLSEELGIDHEQASKFIHEYFALYEGVRFYLQQSLKNAMEKGYAETLGGLKREIPELKSVNGIVRNAGERMAINLPIQGTAAEIIKVAMINLFNELKKKNLESRILLQIHDELLLEAPEKEMELVMPIIKTAMEQVVQLKVPLKVELETGKNWADMQEVKTV